MLGLNLFLVWAGVLVQCLALRPTRKIISRLGDSSIKRFWYLLEAMIYLFILGYVGYGIMSLNPETPPVLIVSSIFFAGALFVMLVLNLALQTVNDFKRVEQDLRDSEASLKEAQRIAQVGDFFWDASTEKIQWSSDQMYYTYGLPVDHSRDLSEVEGIAKFVHPEDLPRMMQAIADIESGIPLDNLRFRIIRPDGETRECIGHTKAIYDDNGTLLRVHGVMQDITKRLRIEEEKEQLQLQLNQAQKMESIGRLAGGVAHDFNNMLGVLMGHLDLVEDNRDNIQLVSEHLKEIRTAAESSVKLTRQLLAFARQQAITPQVVQLNDTVEPILNMLRPIIGEAIQLSWVPGSTLWPIRIDPTQVDQILANLCVNARDAIAGSGNIEIHTDNVVLKEHNNPDFNGSPQTEYVLLSVRDTGEGIPAETLEHIFEPFYTTKDKGTGTGLGLATVYGIIRQNDAIIDVESEVGLGTTFRIYFPRCEEAIEVLSPVEEDQDFTTGGSETILLVEDEPALLKLTTILLEQQGYTIIPAETPQVALDIANNHPNKIHLMITDVIMPEMNGRELVEAMRSIHPHVHCLYMSGYTADVISNQGVIDEGVNFIQKPFDRSSLINKVRSVLDQVPARE